MEREIDEMQGHVIVCGFGRMGRMVCRELGAKPMPFVITERDEAAVRSGLPFADPARSIFLVGRTWLTDPAGELQPALTKRYPTCPGVEVPGIRILCFQPRTARAVAPAQP